MTKRKLRSILAAHKRWLDGDPGGKRASLAYGSLADVDLHSVNLSKADLRGTDLSDANLEGAKLCEADLEGARLSGAKLNYGDLSGANLKGADLFDTNLHGAVLCSADLRAADLRGADLCRADLRGADLSYVCLDYSSWPLWCGSLKVKVDKGVIAQLLYHTLRLMQSCADDPDVAAILRNEQCLKLANQFHRAGECGRFHLAYKGVKIKPPKKGGVKNG